MKSIFNLVHGTFAIEQLRSASHSFELSRDCSKGAIPYCRQVFLLSQLPVIRKGECHSAKHACACDSAERSKTLRAVQGKELR